MLVLLCALALAAIISPYLIRNLGRPAFGVLSLIPLGGFAWVISLFATGTFKNEGALTRHYGWMTPAHLDLTFRLDSLAGFFSLIILGIGGLVLIYCWGYFDKIPRRLQAFAGQMTAFAMAMYGLVISDNFLLMYVFWEITSVLSFLLVGYYGERASSRHSATQALMVTTLGGLSMLVGIILLGRQTGIWNLSEFANVPLDQIPHASYAIILILAGALSKSAIAPAHFWLPGAMAAPTPVSAYLHSAAMVKAGIYLIARLAPDFNANITWHMIIIPLGMFSMLMAGWMSLRQRDLKLVLAYGTLSQLGFLATVVGIGSREALLAGLALTVAHSLFKATLFMIVGAIDHCAGTRDLTELSGLGRKQPYLYSLAILAAASMAGLPPMFGFIAKESVFEAVLHEELLTGLPGQATLVAMVLGSILTMAYSLRFVQGAFGGKEESEAVAKMHHMNPKLLVPPTVLVTLTVFFGVWPHWLDAAINTHLDNTFGPSSTGSHLALWHGFNIPLLLSAIIIVSGSILHWQRAQVARLNFEVPAFGDANRAYDAVLDALRWVSLRLTASTQRGSLVYNLATIFTVLAALPLVLLLLNEKDSVRIELWDSLPQAAISAVLIIVAVTVTVQQNRLSALILVGITGIGMAMVFALQGAPDLALTQLLVETITVVIFMLVLRRFPANTQWVAPPRNRRARAWLSISVGLSAVVVSVFAANARNTEAVSAAIPDLAYEIGHGANAVNVLLVDIRAWDTFGEGIVLVVAALGVASLIYRTRSFSAKSRRPILLAQGRRWLAANADDERVLNRSLMVDVVTRLLFPSMLVLSVYFFFSGHNAPGGGFAGGLVAGLALTLRYLAGGRRELDSTMPIDATTLLGVGALTSTLSAVWPMFFGDPPLTSYIWDVELPLIGDIHVASALLFDLGVYLIVVGLTLHILRALGGQLDEDEEERKERARERVQALRERQTVGATKTTRVTQAGARPKPSVHQSSGPQITPPNILDAGKDA
ncbi:MAG: Na+/H+ antiporter subunit A [Corynebacterium sp.]|nr:Na+/H+ antiporter subunit A [Corynebacterium sp.]